MILQRYAARKGKGLSKLVLFSLDDTVKSDECGLQKTEDADVASAVKCATQAKSNALMDTAFAAATARSGSLRCSMRCSMLFKQAVRR